MSIIDKVEVEGTIYDIVGGGLLPHLVISTDSGLTVTVTKGTTTITATETSEGIYECDVTEFGTYTLSDTENTKDVVIDTVTIYQLSMTPPVPDGETVLPTDDVTTWLECAGIKDKSYTTLQQVLADSITFNALLGDSNANAYLARSTTWATTICANQYAMNLIGQYDVCCDALLGNSTWLSAIASSSYADYVLNATVPTMTSNTAPSGTCFASIVEGDVQPYLAFDGDNSTNWATVQSYDDAFIGYQFPSAVCIRRAKFRALYGNRQFTVAYSDDGTNYTTCSETVTATNAETDYYVNTTETSPHEYWRLNVHHTQGASGFFVQTVQFYGHKDTGSYIHGANNEVAYYLDGGTQTPISDPSTLDAGTYTFGSTVAKNPDSLATDYTKSIRITPNTVEVVLRPDNALYWYGYEDSNLETMNKANGWEISINQGTPQYNTNNIYIASATNTYTGVGSKIAITTTKAYGILNGHGGLLGMETTKNFSASDYASVTGDTTTKYECQKTSASYYPKVFVLTGNITIYAFWYE